MNVGKFAFVLLYCRSTSENDTKHAITKANLVSEPKKVQISVNISRSNVTQNQHGRTVLVLDRLSLSFILLKAVLFRSEEHDCTHMVPASVNTGVCEISISDINSQL